MGESTRARRRIGAALTAAQWRSVAAMVAVVAGLHAVGFFLLIGVVAPHHYRLGGSGAFTIGVGLTAYTLGLRHAFDADHIAAIDNTTRKLMSEGKRPMSVGFFFSLGHSSVVFALAFLFAIGVRALGGPVTHPESRLHHLTSLIGTGVSGTFLYLIGILNLIILVGIVRVFRDMRRGGLDEADLEHRLNDRGLSNRIYSRFTGAITHPWQMFPLGLLFGIGFDTASEVALLFLAAGAAGAGLPFYAILCLPVLFAAGMSLPDTIDGSFMTFAYGWAFSQPVRKVYYNITITGLSALVALGVGTIELAGIFSGESVDMGAVGVVIVGMFVVTWAVSLGVWHFGRIEERWSVEIEPRRP
jgi:high-affinity nickel-transport protein